MNSAPARLMAAKMKTKITLGLLHQRGQIAMNENRGKVELQRDGNGRQCRSLRHKSWIDPKLLHARDKRRAFESEARRGTVGAANTPAGAFENS
jgi:hypothetical protein